MEFAMNVVPAHGPRAGARRAAGIATLLVLMAAGPAFAEEAAPKVNGFKPIERPVTPGERAASQAYARPGTNPGGSMLGITGDSDNDSRSGVQFYMSGGAGWGNVNSMGSRRSNELLGDGVSVYDAEPFYSNSRSYYSPYTGYQRATPRLQYNQSFLRHMYNGNIAGVPSVTAPLEFWDGRR
jgi:hypothetical protein